MKLAGTTAIVTGGSSGIGRSAALALGARGARVAVNYHNHRTAAEDVVQAIRAGGGVAMAVQADVTQIAEVRAMHTLVETELGVPQVIVSSAGSSIRRDVFNTTTEQLRWTFDSIIVGTFNLFQIGAERLCAARLDGSFLAIGSVHATIAFPNALAYNVSKAGLNQLARTFAAELLPYKIKVNVLTPGLTDTPGERQFRTDAELRVAAQHLPLGRMATAEEIGRMAAWLLSDDNAYMTGSVVIADGGINVSLVLSGVTSPTGG